MSTEYIATYILPAPELVSVLGLLLCPPVNPLLHRHGNLPQVILKRRQLQENCITTTIITTLQPAAIGWPTGNGKKLSQACCLDQLCLVAA